MGWIFAYGSLMWDFEFSVEEMRPGVLDGYHREFNKKSTRSWGTRETPAPVLGLETGGACEGVGLRLPDDRFEEIVDRIDTREGGSYDGRRREIEFPDGRTATARVWINRRNHTFIGDISLEDRARMAVDAAGNHGLAVEYVLNTRDTLEAYDITDPHVDRFADLVVDIAEEGSSR